MGRRENFTADRVTKFICEPGKQQTLYWDGKTPGLGLRITMAGARSYIFETRLHGKTLRQTIGDQRTWTIGKAQAEATRLKAMADQGIDPRQQKIDLAVAAEAKKTEYLRQEVTLADAWKAYVLARKHKWSERHAQDHESACNRGGEKRKRGKGNILAAPLASLLDVKLSDLTAERIASWLDLETSTRPTSTALAFRLLRGCLNWCESEKCLAGLVPVGSLAAPKVRDALPRNATKDDCLQREQLALWFAYVRRLGNPIQAAYLQSLLLTGARREELAGIKWSDVDFKWKTIVIRDKVEGERTIPLTPYVESLLAPLPRRNEWVFSSLTAKSGRLMEPRLAHNKALLSAGLPPLTLHGLRRSFGTLSEWCEVPVGIVAQLMGHKPSAIAEKHYKRRSIDLLRMWHTKIEAWILEQAEISWDQPAAKLQAVNLSRRHD
jgi:integrase